MIRSKEELDLMSNGRRDFFTKIFLASLAVSFPPLVTSCRGTEMEFRGEGKIPYKVWQEILQALRSSPDHLEGKMQRLIKQGDPKAMFHFIRDDIQLIPVYNYKIGYGNQYRWGLDYALRSGFATMAEKANLLLKMYSLANIPAKVVYEGLNIPVEEAPQFFFRPAKNQFAPEISSRTLRRWAKELGIKEEVSKPTQEKQEDANQLAEQIWQHLNMPNEYYYKSFDFRWPNSSTPTIEFQWQGETKYAHLIDPMVTFGNLRNDKNKINKARDIQINKEKVKIIVTYRDSIEQNKEKELIEGQWMAADLVGRQLNIRFLNSLTLEEQSVVPVGNIRTFTPSIGLQAMDTDIHFMSERSFLADPITLEGKRITFENGTPKIDGIPVSGEVHLELQKKVASLSPIATPFGSRGVKLEVFAKDVDGNLIEGLGGSDFKIFENGKPVKAFLNNIQRTPKILIMADQSASMPSKYRGEGMQAHIDILKGKILEKYPDAKIDYWKTPSSLFTWLLKASQTENDLVVFATDGHNNDKYDPKNESIYRSGPPAIIIDVYNRRDDYYVKTFKKMASLTNGVHLPITEDENIVEAILKELGKIDIPPYIFTYQSVEKPGTKKVTLSTNNDKTVETINYTGHQSIAPTEVGPSIIGVYLTLKYSNHKSVNRVLAGWDPVVYPYGKPTQKMADEVNDLFFGGVQLYIEGNGPTFSASLSDVLKAKLSTQKWGEALIENDLEKAKSAFKEGQFSISSNALFLMAPLTDAVTQNTLTIPGGLRIGIQKFSPGFISGIIRSEFDYLPTSKYYTIVTDKKLGFKTTLEKTAQLAIRESLIYSNNTLHQLQGKKLINIKQAQKDKWFNGRDAEGSRYWYNRVRRGSNFKVFDASAQSRAYWEIANTSGELYGILPNGSGGGEDIGESEIEQYNRIVQNLNRLMWVMDKIAARMGTSAVGLNPIGGLALGVVARYGELLIKLYALATEAIMIMDASFVNEGIRKALAEFACQVKSEIMGALTGTSAGTEMMESLISAIAPSSYKNPFGCD